MQRHRESAVESPIYQEFTRLAQDIVDNVQAGFDGETGSVHIHDTISSQGPETFIDRDGTTYVHARKRHGIDVPVNIDNARKLASERNIILTNVMIRHALHIYRGRYSTEKSEPTLVIDWIDLNGRRIVTEMRFFYDSHRHSYIPIRDLATAATETPDNNKVMENGIFGSYKSLPQTASQYMDTSMSLLRDAFSDLTANKRRPQTNAVIAQVTEVIREAAGQINLQELNEILQHHCEHLRQEAKESFLGDELARTRDVPEAKNARERLIQNAINIAHRNLRDHPSNLAPFTFDEVVTCADKDALIEAFEKIPDPHFRVKKVQNSYVLIVDGGKSTPNTLGMTYEVALKYASDHGLILSKKEDAYHAMEYDAWIDGGLASASTPPSNYSHPAIGALLSKELPLDTTKLGITDRVKVAGKSFWRVITFQS